MRIRSTTLIAVISSLAIAAAQVPKGGKNLVQNGDFSAGIAKWSGDGKAEVFKAGEAPPTSASDTPAAATPPVQRASLSAIGKPDADRSLCVTLSSRTQKFYQSVTVPRDAKGLKITYRARTGPGFLSSRNDLGAFQIVLERPDRSTTYSDQRIEAKPDWQAFTESIALKEYSRSINVMFEIFSGTGRLYFDDLVVEAQ